VIGMLRLAYGQVRDGQGEPDFTGRGLHRIGTRRPSHDETVKIRDA